jgi:hypothetical protein
MQFDHYDEVPQNVADEVKESLPDFCGLKAGKV